MIFSGYADEVSQDFEEQLRATKALGWSCIEARGVYGSNLTDLDDATFDRVLGLATDAGVRIHCFGSAIANGRRVKDGEDEFEKAIADLRGALPRMRKAESAMIRGMSFKLPGDGDQVGSEYERKVLETIRTMARMCADAGVIYVHENCSGYGSLSPEHTLRLVETTKGVGFGLAFDTGNPVGSSRLVGSKPWRSLTSLAFYREVKEHVVHFHVKDGRMVDALSEDGKPTTKRVHVFPGRGEGSVEEILRDLFARGYDGCVSIEPHVQPPEYDRRPLPFPEESERFNMYVDYGRATMALVAKARGAAVA